MNSLREKLLPVLALCLCLAIEAEAFAQQDSSPRITEATRCNGEYTGMLFAWLRGEISKTDKPVILVARLGDGETHRDLSRERLNRACQGITQSSLSSEKVIKTEGERVKGKGRVEIYVDGLLKLVLLADRNKYICISCCEGCRDLPPWYSPKWGKTICK